MAQQERIEEDETQGGEEQSQDLVPVNLEADEDDEQETAETRQERRSSYKKLKDAFEAEKTVRAERDRELENMRREVAELRGSVQSIPRQAPQQSREQEQDPDMQEAQWCWQSQQDLLARIQATPKGQDASELVQRYNSLDNQRIVALGRAGARQYHGRQQQSQPSAEAQLYYAQHRDVASDPHLSHLVQAEIWALRKQQGIPPQAQASWDLVIEATQRVKSRLGIGKEKPKPNAEDAAKRVGTSGRAGTQGGQGGGVALTKGEMRTALAYYEDTPHRDKSDEWKLARWAKKFKTGAE